METPTQTPTQTRMRALAVRRRPGVGELAGCLESIEVPIPEPGPKEVRVRVCACSINIDDQHLTALTQLPELRRLTVMSPLLTANSAVTLEHIPRLAIWFCAGPLDCAEITITRFSCKGVYGR